MNQEKVDVVIVGGGPAGMSAALLLGRARKTAVVIDEQKPRHAVAEGVHNFLSREGISPQELRRVSRAQIAAFPTVSFVDDRVERVEGSAGAFEIETTSGRRYQARAVLLALGMIDQHPAIPGFDRFWGGSIQHCPYCHGWEVRDQPIGIIGHTEWAAHQVLLLRGWTDDLVLFTHGIEPAPELRHKIESAGISIETAAIVELEGEGHALSAVRLADGRRVPRSGLFLPPNQRQTPLVERLGLRLTELGSVAVDAMMETSMPGVWAAGDCAEMRQSVIVSAAQGTMAAAMLNARLTLPAP